MAVGILLVVFGIVIYAIFFMITKLIYDKHCSCADFDEKKKAPIEKEESSISLLEISRIICSEVLLADADIPAKMKKKLKKLRKHLLFLEHEAPEKARKIKPYYRECFCKFLSLYLSHQEKETVTAEEEEAARHLEEAILQFASIAKLLVENEKKENAYQIEIETEAFLTKTKLDGYTADDFTLKGEKNR